MENTLRYLSNLDISVQICEVRNKIINYLKDIGEDFFSIYEEEEKAFLNSLLSALKYKEYKNKEEFTKNINLYNQLISLKKNLELIKI